jgi:NhaP-type Na+/H+ and K+/H+ antiporter
VTQNAPHQPSRSDRLRPAELVGLSGAMALFVGVVILLTTREIVLSAIAFGITFIIALVSIAMFALGMKPNAAEESDLDEQNHGH